MWFDCRRQGRFGLNTNIVCLVYILGAEEIWFLYHKWGRLGLNTKAVCFVYISGSDGIWFALGNTKEKEIFNPMSPIKVSVTQRPNDVVVLIVVVVCYLKSNTFSYKIIIGLQFSCAPFRNLLQCRIFSFIEQIFAFGIHHFQRRVQRGRKYVIILKKTTGNPYKCHMSKSMQFIHETRTFRD